MSIYKMIFRLTAVLSGLSLLGLASTAGAAVVAYKDNGFIYGNTPYYSSNDFTITDPGTYKATLTDFNFPQSLQQLGLIITDGGSNELDRLTGPGFFTFDAAPGTYSADLYGVAGGSLQLGLYGISVIMDDGTVGGVPAPVALPSALILLGSALLVFGGVARRRHGWAAGAAAA